ncbi:hypothetical protein PICSAR10_04043 [Mycobacterium avium subsp. paratuberculosis]|nr:hypothetical protein PICSAR10_04043 [Mycobacterium avium subsp. paratuberculosis]
MPCAAASSAAWSVSRKTIALAPSGGSGASHPCSAASTRSAGTIASAGPPLPCPSSTDTVGVSRVTSSARHWAIWPASPPCSASADNAGPAVSITSTSGSRSSAARAMPRRASRSDAGPTNPPVRRCWPSTTTGWPANRASANSVVAASPWPVPDNSTGSVAPCRSNSRTPGRSGRREATTESHAATSGIGSGGGGAASGSGASAMTVIARSSVRRSSSSGTTPSITPCRCRFSAVWTPSGNGSP